MHTEIRRAELPGELRALVAFDRRVFPAADRFPAKYWRQLESYWLLVGGRKAGCCAFERHAGFFEDAADARRGSAVRGCLYIASTGILPEFQRQGFGRVLKAWQIAFARREGFHRVLTNTRQRNKAMIALNESFGFRIVRISPRYYSQPVDATVVMELTLGRGRRRGQAGR